MNERPDGENDTKGSDIQAQGTDPSRLAETHFTTAAQAEFKQRGGKRLLWAGLAAVGILVLLILFGPSRETMRKKFEFIGAEGPLVLMQELSIDEGHDPTDQIEKFLQENPPPPSYEIEDIPPDDTGEPALPNVVEDSPVVPAEVYSDEVADPDLDEVDLVEMNMAPMTNDYFRLIHLVKPEYPSLATEADRRIPRVEVTVAIFVNEKGEVTNAFVKESDASPVFDEVAIRAALQWKFEPIGGEAPSGMWVVCTIGFKGPYS